jgi:hypothetical protein
MCYRPMMYWLSHYCTLLDQVCTAAGVYAELRAGGYQVDWSLCLGTDESALEEKDFDQLHDTIRKAGPDTPLIFNCQLGRGRTTTAMVVAQLVRKALLPAQVCLLFLLFCCRFLVCAKHFLL